MKKKYLGLLTFLISFSGASFAQLTGTNCYLQGRYLEIGQNRNASFGTCNPQGAIPAGYHPHSTTLAPPSGTNLAEVYDYGHDGWTVGAPQYMGDFTYPGSPFEGWEIQIGASRAQAFQNCTGTFTAAGVTMAGGFTGYTNSGGSAVSTWTGTATSPSGNLSITQQTRVDTLGSAVVVTAVMRNTGATATGPVYYLRSCDPDNSQTWSPFSFTTTNTIVHQNEDVRHRVLISSRGAGYTGDVAYMGLGTRDCRARCFGYSSWWIGSGVDLAGVWGGSATGLGLAIFNIGQTQTSDYAIGLVYNIGSIPAGDSALISYAYIFNGNMGIDSAFPDPQIVLNNVPQPVVAPPNPNYDTFNACLVPGLISLPVDIRYASDKNWSWSHWTWSPSTGLATTTGVTNTININALPPIITFTITGTDSGTGMMSCHNKTFYLTIITCNGAEANEPCAGDTLWLNSPGDSTAATYEWYGPAPYSSTPFGTTQKTFRYPATTAMSGTYMVIKTVLGAADTFYTTADIRHKPNVTASSNAPLCQGVPNILNLTAVCDSPSVTYTWSRTPPSFSSSSPTPTLLGFTTADTGVYQVIVESYFGCKDTATTHVTVIPRPDPPTVTPTTPYCQGDTFVPFVVTDVAVGPPAGIVLWYSTPTGGVGTTTPPVVNTSIPGTYTFYFSQLVGSCESERDSVKVVVNPVPAPVTGTMGLCQFTTTTLSDPTSGGTWSSSNPAIASVDMATGTVSGHLPGTVLISYTLPTSCRATTIVTVHPKPLPPIVPEVRPCQFKASPVLSVTVGGAGYSTTWYGLGTTPGTTYVGGVSSIVPDTDVPGVYYYYVTQTSAFGCVSDSATFPVRVVPEPAPPVTRDTSYCQGFPAPPLTAVGDSLRWYISPTSTPGAWAAPVPSTANPGSTTWYVTQTVNTCESPREPISVEVLVLPDFEITADRDWVCQFDSLQLSYDGPTYINPAFVWSLPIGSDFVDGTSYDDQNVHVRFDTAWGRHDVVLTVSNYSGRCFSNDTFSVRVVPAPDAHAYIKPDVCLGDTITLALNSHSDNSFTYTWLLDGAPMFNASQTKINVISANVNTGGPFVISWVDSGLHIINVTGATKEGCVALPTADTVKVHTLPDPRFDVSQIPDKFCVEDSILFTARVVKPEYSYMWEPEHSFVNQNKPEIWGRVERPNSRISLTVTDPFGCRASYFRTLNPDECCTVSLPSAFTPNGDGKNDRFRPLFAGYRRFHIFRVTNRWGQTVFESANSNPNWDGTWNGVTQDMGTYFYYLKFDCGGKVHEAKGDVTLIR